MCPKTALCGPARRGRRPPLLSREPDTEYPTHSAAGLRQAGLNEESSDLRDCQAADVNTTDVPPLITHLRAPMPR